MAVLRQEEDITNAKKLYEWCVTNLSDVGASSTYSSRINAGKCCDASFFVPAQEDNSIQRPKNFKPCKRVKGTRNFTNLIKPGSLKVRDIQCYCDPCKNSAFQVTTGNMLAPGRMSH